MRANRSITVCLAALSPLSSAQAVAARSPGSHLVIAPGAGHSVLGQLSCADDQLANLLAGRRVSTSACNRESPTPYPVPVPPADLGAVRPSGAPGTAGRVAHAARPVPTALAGCAA